jgi:uncharacterized damage-inducible protein DinB
VWPALSPEQCSALAEANSSCFIALIEPLGPIELDGEVAYVNSAGQHFRSSRRDILIHVALHGCYHRGQVALLLREAGAVPEPTDYIAFVRGVPAATRQS